MLSSHASSRLLCCVSSIRLYTRHRWNQLRCRLLRETLCHSVVRLSVCPSVTLEHPAKPLDGMRCHLIATLVCAQRNIVLVTGSGSPPAEGDIWRSEGQESQPSQSAEDWRRKFGRLRPGQTCLAQYRGGRPAPTEYHVAVPLLGGIVFLLRKRVRLFLHISP